ncbi:CAP domain-containing protein [Ilyonectria destructans]|nr:CAP domain-containing protein [Ilyonectria destructans]
MRFSAFVVSTLAANAAAWRFPHRPHHVYTEYYTEVVTVGAPTATEVAVPATKVSTTAVVPAATTLVTKKASSTKAVVAVQSTAAASSSGLTTDQQNALDAHNAARKAVGNADLVWDDDLAAGAQEWADHLVSLGTLEHSGTADLGENLYMQSGSDAPYLNAVDAFVSEKSLYNGEAISSTNYMSFGHYTQVVWGTTTKLGMAVASGSSGTYVVARYSGPGNYIGEKPY